MKPSAFFVNTARGELVDQAALCAALTGGGIAGAGLDTLSPEPVRPDNPLLALPAEAARRVVFSPHVTGTTVQTFLRAHKFIWENVLRCARGEEVINIVN
jgi:phosphoglycerate dehydrogenase-like enzyme